MHKSSSPKFLSTKFQARRPSPKPSSATPLAAPSRNFAAVSPARAAAFEILERIALTSAHSDDLLHGPRLAGLSQADRDLTTALVLGVLRWQIALDARLRPLLSRPDLRLVEPVAIALRLGAFQILHLQRIPVHAALNESVELVRAAGHPQAAGMVNAVLRKLVGAPPVRQPLIEPVAAMAERLGHPRWLAERWATQYGRRVAETICAFDQQEPGCSDLFTASAEPVPAMDAGSRLVAELAAASQPEAKRAWDCCAAPGGKTMILRRRLAPEAELVATDLSSTRLRRLRERLRRDLPESAIELLEADAAQPPASLGFFDLILCDVPCSGTGTLARNPEIRHRLEPAELSRQAERQRRILARALGQLAPGGRLLYSTCSLEPEENEHVVDAVCATPAWRSLVQRQNLAEALNTLADRGTLNLNPDAGAALLRNGHLRTLPGSGFQGDGFFAALLERR